MNKLKNKINKYLFIYDLFYLFIYGLVTVNVTTSHVSKNKSTKTQ